MTTSLAAYHSCSFCRSFILDLDNTSYHGEVTPLMQTANEALVLSNISLADIRRGYLARCHFSQWLISQWIHFDEKKYYSLIGREDDLFLYAITWSSFLMRRFPLDEIRHFGLWDGRTLSPSGSPTWLIRTCESRQINVLTPKGDAADECIWTRPINKEIGSPANVRLARSWLWKCLGSHRKCPEASSIFMPKRILHIRVDDCDEEELMEFPKGTRRATPVIRLCVDEAPTHYVALSYCWGGDQPYKTTKARIESGPFDLIWEQLPKTLQDAVTVTISLGLEYIWIDSFCIIQDDEDDFNMQMAQVPSIYAKSTVTIVASRAAAASQGFLHDISLDVNLDDGASLAVCLPFKCPDGRLGNAFVMSFTNSDNVEPIDFRAWTFQEFWLPTRLIVFGSRQLRWLCSEPGMRFDKALVDGWKLFDDPEDSGSTPYSSRSEMEDSFMPYVRDGMLREERLREAHRDWASILSNYTDRTLEYARDRPWAASGLAEAYSPILQDEYLAGHWRKTLPGSLLWFIEARYTRGTGEKGKPFKVGPRPDGYVAPSWSWASVLGRINTLFGEAAAQDTKLIFLNAATELSEPTARYGAVKSGYVRVKGRMREALYFGTFSEHGTVVWLERPPSTDLNRNLVITRVLPDAKEPEFQGNQRAAANHIQVHLLEVGCCTAGGKRGPVGLVLREVRPQRAELRTFNRLGLFHIDAKCIAKRPENFKTEQWDESTRLELSWFDHCDWETIEII